MAISIKQILASDNIKELVEKVNANFDQLLLNGGGEQGIIGDDGIEGPVGATGVRGSIWFYGDDNPNLFQVTLDPLYEGDKYLQENGIVWEHNGTDWYNTTINLEGPRGTEAASLITSGGANVSVGSAPYDGEDFVFIKPSDILYELTTGGEIRSMLIGGYPSGSGTLGTNAIDDAYALTISAQSTGILFVHSHDAGVPQIVLSGGQDTNTIEVNEMPKIYTGSLDNLEIQNPRKVGSSSIMSGIKLYTEDSSIDLFANRNINLTAKGRPFTGSAINTGTTAGNISIWSDDIEDNNPSYNQYPTANSILIKNTRTDVFNIVKNTVTLELKTVSGTKTGNRYVEVNTLNNDNEINVRLGYVNVANTSGYGLLIRDVIGPGLTNKYGVYQTGSDIKNTFEGSLEVLNGYSISGDITVTQASTNDGMIRLNGKSGSTGPMLMIWNPDQASFDYTKIGARDGYSFSVEKDTTNTTGTGDYIFRIKEDTDDVYIENRLYRDSGNELLLGLSTLGSTIVTSSLTTVGTIGTGTWAATDVAVAHGGTGASTAAQARINLGSEIGVNVQAWDINLDQIAAFAPSDSNFIVGNGSIWVVESGNTARTSLGLGTGNSPTFVDLMLTGDLHVTDDLDCNSITTDGYIYREEHSKGYFVGGQNRAGLGDTSQKTNPIYTIGSSHLATDSSLENMYGIGYSNTNASFLSSAATAVGVSKWGQYVAGDGDARIFLDASTGHIWNSGSLVSGSSVYATGGNIRSYYGATLGLAGTRGGILDIYDNTTNTAYRRIRVDNNQLQFSYGDTTSYKNVMHTGNYTSYVPYISGRRSFTAPASAWYSIARTNGGDHGAATLKIASGTTGGTHNFAKFHITWYHGHGKITQVSGGQYGGGVAFSDVMLHYDSASPWTNNGNAQVYGGGWFSIYILSGKAIYWELEESALSNTTDWSTMDAAYISGTAVQVGAYLANTSSRNLQSTSTVYAPTFSGALSGNASTATLADHADRWTTARTLTISGDASGSVSIDGSANVSLSLDVSSITGNLYASGTMGSGGTLYVAAESWLSLWGNGTTYALRMSSRTATGTPAIWDTTMSHNTYFKMDSGSTRGWVFHNPSNSATAAVQITGQGKIRALSTITAPTFSGALSGNATTASGANGNFYVDDDYGKTIVGKYSATKYQGVYAMGDAYKLPANGSATTGLYGIAWTHSNVGGQSKTGLSHQALFVTNGVTQTAIGTGIWTNGTVTAPTFSGALSGNATTASTATLANTVKTTQTTASASRYFVFTTSGSTGTKSLYTDSAATCYINPSTNTIGASAFVGGSISGSTGTFAGHVSGSVDNTYSLGSYAGKWKYAYINHVYATNISNLWGGTVTCTDSMSIAGVNVSSGNLAITDGHVTVGSNNDTNLGSGSLQFASIYARYYENNSTYGHYKMYGPSVTGTQGYIRFFENAGSAYIGVYNTSAVDRQFKFYTNGDAWFPGTLSAPSDIRLKEDIEDVYLEDDFLDKIHNIRIINYNKTEEYNPRKRYGVIAQEFEKLFPEYVHENDSDWDDDPEGTTYLSVAYSELSLLGIRGVQKLIDKNKVLEDKVETLENRLQELEDKVNKL